MATKYTSLPKAWSNKGEVERLREDAAASLSRAVAAAVADTGVNFSVWSALRTKAEQVALFEKNYRNTGRTSKTKSTDRWYAGTVWARRSGSVAVASPDLGSNHQSGVAVDIHPAAIQSWFKTKGAAYGWSWAEGKRVGEDWHFRYFPENDGMRSWGELDHAAVQKAVGAGVDGKIGTGTVAKIKAWQKAHGLSADGKVGPRTKAAMLGKDVADVVEEITDGVSDDLTTLTIADLPEFEVRLTANANHERFGETVQYAVIHWWGTPSGQKHDDIVDYLVRDRGDSGTSAHFVVSPGRITRTAEDDWTAWGNGNRTYNRRSFVIECDPNDVAGTLPYVAALLKDLRTRYSLKLIDHNDIVPTTCPGDYEPWLDELDVLSATGTVTVDLPAKGSIESKAHTLPTGKALLMALIDAPDFPLLRTDKHKCYYGPASGPLESVSGHNDNRLAPGDLAGKGAAGLKTWQRQMNKRGYSLKVDGLYGDNTEKAAKNLQRLAGIAQDGKIGPDAWYAAFILPVQ